MSTQTLPSHRKDPFDDRPAPARRFSRAHRPAVPRDACWWVRLRVRPDRDDLGRIRLRRRLRARSRERAGQRRADPGVGGGIVAARGAGRCVPVESDPVRAVQRALRAARRVRTARANDRDRCFRTSGRARRDRRCRLRGLRAARALRRPPRRQPSAGGPCEVPVSERCMIRSAATTSGSPAS
jgi:hypothetical protein